MGKITKALKLVAFICLIILACLGVGISGGIPLPSIKNRRDSEKEKTELVENKSDTKENESEIKE